MGSDLHIVIVDGDQRLLDAAVDRLDTLERKWSRFLDDSEISAINRADSAPVIVSTDTVVLVDGLRHAWELTDGRFDPTVHDAVVAAGYDAPWPGVRSTSALSGVPAPGCWGMRLRTDLGLVQMPRGVRLDAGGLGKGLAADIVVAELRSRGARGALVSIGGDLRVSGSSPHGGPWRIDVDHPTDPERVIATIELADGGIATTTSMRRRWQASDGRAVHHLIEPMTGLPAERPWQQVTTVSGTAAWAEVAAKVAFLDGRPPDETTSALILGDDDRCRTEGDPAWFRLVEHSGARS